MVDEYRTLEDLVRNLYANVFWTHKIHEKQAEIHECWFAWLSVFNIIFAAATSAGIISLIFTDPQWLKVGSAVTAFITTALSAVLALFDLKSRARDNKSTATKLVCLRNELLTMLAKIKFKNQPVQELMNDFCALQKQVHDVYKDAPNTSNCAVNKAEAAIEKDKDGTYTDEQIDQILPEMLRRGSQG